MLVRPRYRWPLPWWLAKSPLVAIGLVWGVGCAKSPPQVSVVPAVVPATGNGQSSDKKTPDPWDELASSARKVAGFVNYYWHQDTGKVYFEIDPSQGEFLYVTSLARGVGSNALGLDRAQLGTRQVVHFERVGPRVYLIEKNRKFRAPSGDGMAQRAVRESFAAATLWGFEIVAQRNGHWLVDATDFVTRDVHKVAEALSVEGSNFSVDRTRSFVNANESRNFANNTALQASVTLTGKATERIAFELRQSAAQSDTVTVHQEHAFARLPASGYQMRPFHPQAGFFASRYVDFSSPFDQPLENVRMVRHRIEGKYRPDGSFEVTRPIKYYVDSAAPEPIRQAILDGVGWWSEAFAAAGLPGGFVVELLPPDVDPLDLRYNVVVWVHRATRGWSYGATVVDPRTGEIIKGHVSLGSQRIRQDYLLAEALLAPYSGADASTKQAQAQAFALARIRQLAAHEVGHSLGLRHNFAASATAAHSVMDYPMPKLRIDAQGAIDLTQAYESHLGEWDKHAIAMGYGLIPVQESAAPWLEAQAQAARKRGLLIMGDENVWAGSAHPLAHRWDQGADSIAELLNLYAVRERALQGFGLGVIRPGDALAELQRRLVPLYLLHRYQIEATVKSIGGVTFYHATTGADHGASQVVAANAQRAALAAILRSLTPEFLGLPAELASRILPRAPSTSEFAELFSGRAGDVFDPIEAAAQSAWLTLELLLDRARIERLDQQSSHDKQALSPSELINRLLAVTWPNRLAEGFTGAVVRRVQIEVVRGLRDLADDANASPQARGHALLGLERIAKLNQRMARASSAWQAHAILVAQAVEGSHAGMTLPLVPVRPLKVPPGAPIGEWSLPFDAANMGNVESMNMLEIMKLEAVPCTDVDPL